MKDEPRTPENPNGPDDKFSKEDLADGFRVIKERHALTLVGGLLVAFVMSASVVWNMSDVVPSRAGWYGLLVFWSIPVSSAMAGWYAHKAKHAVKDYNDVCDVEDTALKNFK